MTINHRLQVLGIMVSQLGLVTYIFSYSKVFSDLPSPMAFGEHFNKIGKHSKIHSKK